jgi:hypothetical protein
MTLELSVFPFDGSRSSLTSSCVAADDSWSSVVGQNVSFIGSWTEIVTCASTPNERERERKNCLCGKAHFEKLKYETQNFVLWSTLQMMAVVLTRLHLRVAFASSSSSMAGAFSSCYIIL